MSATREHSEAGPVSKGTSPSARTTVVSVSSPHDPAAVQLNVSIAEQRLDLWVNDGLLAQFPVSTAARGPNERNGSGGTPRGCHRVRLKVGAGCPVGAVFRGRRWTGEVYSEELARTQPDRDWILSRILWLTGLEPGRNRNGEVDTLRRYIYIHGCPDSEPMGVPRSHGCVRMRNEDLIWLFDRIPGGCPVFIG